jgi:signal transduction histidine kinase
MNVSNPRSQSHDVGIIKLAFDAAERECTRVADLLRADAAQVMTTALIGLTGIGELANSAEMRGVIEDLRTEIRAGVARLQDLATLIRPSVLDDFGLAAATRSICDCLSSEYGLPIEIDTPAALARLLPADESLVYRIVEEALRNAVCHAMASRVLVRITQAPDSLTFEVTDDGRGFSLLDPSTAKERSGLQLMHARAQVLNATLAIRSQPNAGTRVTLGVSLKGAG